MIYLAVSVLGMITGLIAHALDAPLWGVFAITVLTTLQLFSWIPK